MNRQADKNAGMKVIGKFHLDFKHTRDTNSAIRYEATKIPASKILVYQLTLAYLVLHNKLLEFRLVATPVR